MPHPYQMARQRMNHIHHPQEADMPVTKIFWDDDEKRRVAVESFRLLRADDSLSNMAAIEQAQRKVLKADRRRDLAKTTFTKFRPWILDMWTEIEKQWNKPALAAVPATSSPEKIPTVVPDAAPPDEAKRTLVRWNEEEKQRIAARVHHLTSTFEDMPRMEALRKAIDSELPAERQREIIQWKVVAPWLDPLLAQCAEEEQRRRIEAHRVREREEREQHERERQQREAEAVIEQEVQRRVEAQLAEHDHQLRTMTVDSVVRLFADRVANILVEAFSGTFSQAMSAQLVALNPSPAQTEHKPPEPPKERLPRVTVVGLLNQQAEDVKQAFLGTVEFVFVKSQMEGGGGHGGAGMLTKSATSDLVILMTDHCGHDVNNHAKHLKVPYHRMPGSVSSLKRWLTAWLAGEGAGA